MSAPTPSLFDTLVNLARDPGARAAFDADPAGYLKQAGLHDVSPQDVHDAAPLVAETVGTSLPPTPAGGDTGSAVGEIRNLVHGTAHSDTAHGDVAPGASHALPPEFRDVDDFRTNPHVVFADPVDPGHVPSALERLDQDLGRVEQEAHNHGFPDAEHYVDGHYPGENNVYDVAPTGAYDFSFLFAIRGLAHDAGYDRPSDFVRAAHQGLDPVVTQRLQLAAEARAHGYPDTQHYLQAWHDGQVDLDGTGGGHDALKALAQEAGHGHTSVEQLLNGHNHGGETFPPSPEPHEPPYLHGTDPSHVDVDALETEAHNHGFPNADAYLHAAPFPGETAQYFRDPGPSGDFSQLRHLREQAHDAGYDDVERFARQARHGLSDVDRARLQLAHEARANGYPDSRSYLDAYHRGELDLRDPNAGHTDHVYRTDPHAALKHVAQEATHGHTGVEDYLNSGLHHGQHPLDPPRPWVAIHHEPPQPIIDGWPTHRPEHIQPDPGGTVGTESLPQHGGDVLNPTRVDPIDRVVDTDHADGRFGSSLAGRAPGLDDHTAAHQGEPGEVHGTTSDPGGPRPDAGGPGNPAPGTPGNQFGAGHTGGSTSPVGHGPAIHGGAGDPSDDTTHPDDPGHGYGQHDLAPSPEHHDDPGHGLAHAHDQVDHHGTSDAADHVDHVDHTTIHPG